VDLYIGAIEADSTGFGTNQASTFASHAIPMAHLQPGWSHCFGRHHPGLAEYGQTKSIIGIASNPATAYLCNAI